MTSIADIKRQKAQNDAQFEPNHETPWGVIVEVDGSTSPPNRPNMTWVDMYNRGLSRLAAINETTDKTAGTPVQLGPAPKPPYLKVVSTFDDSLNPTDSTTNLGQFNTSPHGPNHQWPTEATRGSDAAKIYQPAIQMLKLTGNGTNLTVSVQPLIYWVNGTRKTFPGANLDLASYVPGTAGQTKRTLVYLDKDTNNLAVVEGTAVSGAIPIPFPDAPANAIPSDFVRLTNGQTAVTTTTHVDEGRGLMGGGNGDTSPFEATADGQIIISENGAFVVAKPLVDIYGDILTDTSGTIVTV
jgi:hypothetical protein